MKKEFKNKLRKSSKKAWSFAEENMLVMSTYLSNGAFEEGTNAEDILRLMFGCNAIVVGELYTNTKRYKKYGSKNYTEENFVDIIIESIGQDTPQKGDIKAIFDYVENFRSILWGYAKSHCVNYLKLYMEFIKYAPNADINSRIGYLRECMTIVVVECMLRTMEKSISR